MLKISDFSRIGQVSSRTLRLYDELGLLRPVYVDRWTGYRYYSLEQLPRLNRILALRDLDFSLEEIARLLEQGLETEEMRGMLWLKRCELERQVREEQARLRRVEARLNQLEREDKMPEYEVVLKKVAPQVVASSRQIIKDEDHKQEFTRQVLEVSRKRGLKESGPQLYMYHHFGYRDGNVDLEIALPVEADPANTGTIGQHSEGWVNVYQLPGVSQMASLVYQGSTDTIFEAYQAIGSWMHNNGYCMSGPCREVYLQRDPEHKQHLIEIQFPVERAQ